MDNDALDQLLTLTLSQQQVLRYCMDFVTSIGPFISNYGMIISSTAFLKELFQIFLSLYSKHVCHLFLDYSLNNVSSDEDERVAFLPKTASPLKKFVLIHDCPGTGTCTLSLFSTFLDVK